MEIRLLERQNLSLSLIAFFQSLPFLSVVRVMFIGYLIKTHTHYEPGSENTKKRKTEYRPSRNFLGGKTNILANN